MLAGNSDGKESAQTVQVEAPVESKPSQGLLWVETGVVLLAVVVPHLFNSVASVYLPSRSTPFAYQMAYILLSAVEAIALVLFIIWRSGESWRSFGICRLRIGADLFGGIAVLLISIAAYYGLWVLLSRMLGGNMLRQGAGAEVSFFDRPSSALSYVLLAAMCVGNGIAEELVMRAYLIRRLEQISRSTVVACMLSTALFAAYHTYQGPAGIVSSLALGGTYSVVFAVTRRLAPLAIAHALQDAIGVLRLIA